MSAMPPMRRGVGARVARALINQAGGALIVERLDTRPWASATFTGARHEGVVRLPDRDAARQFARGLPDAHLPMPGHVAIDAVAEPLPGRDHCLNVTILTIEDC